MANPTPEEIEDAMAHIRAYRMKKMAAILELGAAFSLTGISVRQFARAIQAAEAADFAEFCEHPDMLELRVATGSWYPET